MNTFNDHSINYNSTHARVGVSGFCESINYAKAIADAEKWFTTIPCEPESRNLFDTVLYVADLALKECDTLKDQLKQLTKQNNKLKNQISDFLNPASQWARSNNKKFNYIVIKKRGELPIFIRKSPLSVVKLSLSDLIYANTLLAIWCEKRTDYNLEQLNDFLNEMGD